MDKALWLDLGLLIALGVVLASVYFLFVRNEAPTELGQKVGLKDSSLRKWSIYPGKVIRHAGMSPDGVVLWYWFAKISIGCLAPLLVNEFLADWSALQLGLLALTGFMVPDLWILKRRRARRAAIARSLSFFVDLIVVFLNSGLSLSQAFKRAAESGLPDGDPLAREVRIVAQELEAGRPRHTAFHALAERTGVVDLERLASVLNVGLRLGNPVGDSLSAQADLLREKQLQRGIEVGNRKSLEAMFPMMLVSLPIFLVLVMFPAAVQIYEAYQAFTSAL